MIILRLIGGTMLVVGGAALLYVWYRTRTRAMLFQSLGSLLAGAQALWSVWGLGEWAQVAMLFAAAGMVAYGVYLAHRDRAGATGS